MSRLSESNVWVNAPQRSTTSISDDKARNDVKAFLAAMHKQEFEWKQKPPQSEKDVASLFSTLVLQNHSYEERRNMACEVLLQVLAQQIRGDCELQLAVLIGACEVAIKEQMICIKEATRILLPFEKTEEMVRKKRTAIPKLIFVMDMMHDEGVLGKRTYELIIHRDKKVLSRIANWRETHIKQLELILSDDHGIYKPDLQFDSTYLRLPNLIHVLFAGRINLFQVETSLQPPKWPCREIRLPKNPMMFFKFISLDQDFEQLRASAYRETVGLAPTLKHSKLTGYQSCPELCGFLERQRSEIKMVAESHLLNVNFNQDSPPLVIELESGAGIHSDSGDLTLAVLLNDVGVEAIMKDGTEVKWNRNQILCFAENGFEPKDEGKTIIILMIVLRLEPFLDSNRHQ